MNPSERDVLIHHLENSRDLVSMTVQGLTLDQLRFSPGEGRWSIADCVEHIGLIENRALLGIQAALQSAPQPERRSEVSKTDSIFNAVSARQQRVQGPPHVAPKGQWTDFAALLADFEAARERTIRLASETDADPRCHFMPHPLFGLLDCYQWLMLLGSHSERHVRQMEEVKADSRFPRSAGASA